MSILRRQAPMTIYDRGAKEAGSTPTIILAAHPRRVYALLANSDNETIYIRRDDMSADAADIPIEPGGNYSIWENVNLTTGVITGYSVSGGKFLNVEEGIR